MEKYTPEEKALLQESRTLSDAKLIREGAHYVPDMRGEPILELGDEEQKLELVWRNSPDSLPESQKLWKIGEKIFGHHHWNNEWKKRSEINEVHDGWKHSLITFTLRHRGGSFSDGSGDTGRPYILIQTNISRGNTGTGRYDECYSLQEFYDNLQNLLPKEREAGEAFGKELESYLKD